MSNGKPTLSPKQAYELLKRFVDEKGADYKYEPVTWTNEHDEVQVECRYLAQDGVTPSCIVGHVFVAVGVPTAEILSIEGNAAFTAIPEVLDVERDSAVVRALDSAQKAQDGGQSWGDALASFEDDLNEIGVEYR